MIWNIGRYRVATGRDLGRPFEPACGSTFCVPSSFVLQKLRECIVIRTRLPRLRSVGEP